MTEQLTPPPELVRKWIEDWAGGQMKGPVTEDQLVVATQAARWGADQELEACVNYVDNNFSGNKARALRAIRRPKPSSLKEQALKAIGVPTKIGEARVIEHRQHELIRRALNELPNE